MYKWIIPYSHLLNKFKIRRLFQNPDIFKKISGFCNCILQSNCKFLKIENTISLLKYK